MPRKAKAVALPSEISKKLFEWTQAQQQLEVIKAKEFELRQFIVANAGFDPSKLEGVQTIDIGNGWKLKADKSQNYSLTNKNGETLALLNAVGTHDPVLATALVDWKPDLKIKPYRELLKITDQIANLPTLLSAALTVKPGAPQLSLVPPEEEKK